MNGVKRYLRLRYANETALEEMLKAGTVSCRDADFALTARPGDGVVLANFDEAPQAGEVRAIGIVSPAVSADGAIPVRWHRTSFSLHPSPQGLCFWRQAKPFFVFAKDVVERYRLPAIFGKAFAEIPTACPVSASEERSENPPGSFGKASDAAGYVYLIRSLYGYKIGKTKRMKERARLFSVKLPFDFEIAHYAWCADYHRAETILHRRYGHKRLNGEWFSLDHADVEEIKRFTWPERSA
ncbi:GIY-YIG nuclease family protein [Thioalkalicoccus limnaeus]|uniref:GIY-YIG nuclease family protein n=1 Tax=Thioalkalicoccus limnaeus TaxID=120681 RepID=A0ABV4BB92_9GAMM